MKRKRSPKRTGTERRYKAASVLCNILGTFILLFILAICLPLTVPRFMGYEIYNVVSGSMEPAIPTGSIVFAAPAEPGELQEGDVIAFQSGESVIVHRVRENRRVEGELVTKGDANDTEDIQAVDYDSVLGVVTYHVPVLGRLSAVYTSALGKLYALGFAVAALLFYMLAARLKDLSRPAMAPLSEAEPAPAPEEPRRPEGGAHAGTSRKRSRKKGVLFWAVVVLCCAAFIYGAAMLGGVAYEYISSRRIYDTTAEEVVTVRTAVKTLPAGTGTGTGTGAPSSSAAALESPPIQVDFEALRAVNPDVIGWIYCEGTVINYPVVQGEDNSYYLHHAYTGAYSASASIFAECSNRRDFQDANTILYGHHMRDGSMFAGLEYFREQDYYEAHPVMWLLTPEGNYKIELFSGYTTAADSDAYRIYDVPGDALDEYIRERLALSDFRADGDFIGADKIVTLSTCAYVFNNARYVVHGVLIPAGA